MRKLILAGVFAIVTIVSSNAQENIVKVNPVGIAFGLANASYELKVADKQSVSISGSYFQEKSLGIKTKGFGANLGYNFYFLSEKNAPRGFHAGPNAGVLFLTDNTSNATVLTAGATVGHQWIFADHFSLDLFGTFDYFTTTKLSGLESTNIGLGVSLGYAW